MTTFVQFHLLTAYGPSNPNRDDQGRPKQAMVGGVPRLRMSSQSLKRALRESNFFALDLADHSGTRTKRFGVEIIRRLKEQHPNETIEKLHEVAAALQRVFANVEVAKPKKGEEQNATTGLVGTTLAFISPEEWAYAEKLAADLISGAKLPKPKDLALSVLRKADGAIDIAMFGRMLTDETADGKIVTPRVHANREAAVQVAHAFTTHRAQAEEDYFTAVDDLNKAEDTGAGHLGEHGFGSGIYYQYICVNVDLLTENLNGDKALAQKVIAALASALPVTTPRGKQNSHAHHPMAYYIRAERGPRAPRDLSGAFFTPVDARLRDLGANDLQTGSIRAMDGTVANLDKCYHGGVAEDHRILNVLTGEGTLAEIVAFAEGAVA